MKKGFVFKRLGLAGALFVFGVLSLSLAPTQRTYAQTTTSPQFLITWKATGSYIPPSYNGKALPSYGSKITASLELVSQNTLLNLRNETIYWYLDDVLIGGGNGVQTVTFPPFGAPPDSLTLKVELPDYAGGYLSHAINIPYVDPQVVLYAPFPSSTFTSNPFDVYAIPYFFNTSSSANLSYAWAVNGQSGGNAENPEEAQITLPAGTPSGTSIDVSITVENPIGSTAATADQSLVYESQP